MPIVENKNPLKQDVKKTEAATYVCELMFTRSMFETPDMIEQHNLLNHLRVGSMKDEFAALRMKHSHQSSSKRWHEEPA